MTNINQCGIVRCAKKSLRHYDLRHLTTSPYRQLLYSVSVSFRRTAINEKDENHVIIKHPDYIDIVDRMESPRIIKTHLSFEMLPGNNLIKLFFSGIIYSLVHWHSA
jgi:hypothetical protein